jgi:hypothetical protein
MTRKAFTGFGVGPSATDAMDRTLAPLPAGIVRAQEIAVPDGVNPSKLGTWIQRYALDETLSDDVPSELHVHIRTAAGALDDPNVVLAIDMTGSPAGDKMRARLGATDTDNTYLLFGLTAAS